MLTIIIIISIMSIVITAVYNAIVEIKAIHMQNKMRRYLKKAAWSCGPSRGHLITEAESLADQLHFWRNA